MQTPRMGPQTAGKARQQLPLGQPDQGTAGAVINPATLASWEKKGGVTAPTSRSESKERQRQGAPPGRAKPAGLPDLGPEVAAVRLVSGGTAADMGDVSPSWWDEKVAEGIAPQPAFRAHRLTRYRLADVVAFWRDFRPSEAAAAGCVDLAVKASAKAVERRRAASAKEVA